MSDHRPTTYRKRPVVIEAMGPLTRENGPDIARWCGGSYSGADHGSISIDTLEGEMTAQIGDFVIRGIEGEFYACKPGIFAATYEELSAE